MQPREFAGEVEAQAVPGHVLADGPAMEPLENVFPRLGRDGRAGVADREPRAALPVVACAAMWMRPCVRLYLRALSRRFCTMSVA